VEGCGEEGDFSSRSPPPPHVLSPTKNSQNEYFFHKRGCKGEKSVVYYDIVEYRLECEWAFGEDPLFFLEI
jgi:hypothetical protein